MKVPEYGRKKVDEIIANVESAAEHSVLLDVDPYVLRMSQDDLIILANMLYEMDRHLPDFFKDEDTEIDDQVTDSPEPTQE